MKRFIIIVSVYDQENTQAYPLGGVFDSEREATKYLNEHLEDVKDNHWTKGRIRGEGQYHEEQSMIGNFIAQDLYNGASLEINIHTLEEM